MTRQRLREGSIKWETQLSIASFSQKVIKKIQHLAFTEKVKIINIFIPEKVKLHIENNLLEELKFFQKKYSFEIKMISDNLFVIPEYKIDLLNKSKKLINSIENINKIHKNNKNTKTKLNKEYEKDVVQSKDKSKKKKIKKKIRTLWVRRKKK